MLSMEWIEAIDAYLTHERAAGKPRTTLDLRRGHLQHLARRVRCGPWAVEAGMLLEYMAAHDWAPETRRGKRTSLDLFYRWALGEGHVAANPAARLPKVKMLPAHARPAPDRVYREALIAARPRERLMLRLAAELGLRRAEVAVIHSRDLFEDLVGHSLLVHGKGGRKRVVPLPRSLARTLLDLGPGYVFPGDDEGHLSPRYVGKLVATVMPQEWTMHTLRHRFATRAYALRSDLVLVQEMLGHANSNTTRRYIEYDRARMRDVVEELAG